MTVKELKKLIDTLPPDMEVALADDFSDVETPETAEVLLIERDEEGEFKQVPWYQKDVTDQSEPVFIISQFKYNLPTNAAPEEYTDNAF